MQLATLRQGLAERHRAAAAAFLGAAGTALHVLLVGVHADCTRHERALLRHPAGRDGARELGALAAALPQQLGEVQRRLGRAAEMQLRLAEHLVPLADDDFRLLCSARAWPRRLRQAAKEARALCVVSALLASLEAHDSGSEQVDEAAAAVRRLRAVCEAKAREVKAAALSRSPSSALATESVGYRTSVPAW